MSNEWNVLGGIGMVSEIGELRNRSHVMKHVQAAENIAKALRIDDEKERMIWEEVCNPAKQEDVWLRIERFKRDNPHLCFGRSEWNFVGKNRLPLNYGELGRRSKEKDEIIRSNCEKVVALLCRTYGKLSSAQAADVARTRNHYRCWSALPGNGLLFQWNCSLKDVRECKKHLAAARDRLLGELERCVRGSTHEQREAIAYLLGHEIRLTNEEELQRILAELKYVTGIGRSKASPPYKRTMRDEFCNGILQIPNPGEIPRIIKEILWAQEIINAPEPTVSERRSQLMDMAFSTYFDGSISGIAMLIVSILAVISALSSIGSLLTW